MRLAAITLALFSLSFASPVYASDNADKANCEVYSKIGGVMVEFMLPLTMQEFVDMMTGKEPKLMEDMTSALIKGLDGDSLSTMLRLGDESHFVGEAAGEVGVGLLMEGRASSAADVRRIMMNDCQEIGFRRIIDNQKAASALTSRNIVQ